MSKILLSNFITQLLDKLEIPPQKKRLQEQDACIRAPKDGRLQVTVEGAPTLSLHKLPLITAHTCK